MTDEITEPEVDEAEHEPLDAFMHRVLWLGRVRMGVQRLLLSRGRVGENGVVPDMQPEWSEELTHLLTAVPMSGEEALAGVEQELVDYDAHLISELEATREAVGEAPLDDLRAALGLTFQEECLLWAVAAPELDPAAARLYRVMDEVQRGDPLLDFVLQVALGTQHKQLDLARAILDPDGALIRLRLLVGERQRSGRLDPGLMRPVCAHRDIVRRMASSDPVPVLPEGPVKATDFASVPEALIFPDAFHSELRRVLGRAARAGALRAWLVGEAGSGRRSVSASMARDLSRQHWDIDTPKLVGEKGGEARLRDLVRESRLGGAVLHFHDADALFADETQPRAGRVRRLLSDLLSDHRGEVFFASEQLPALDSSFDGLVLVQVPRPGPAEREAMWRAHLPDRVEASLPRDLARRYFLTGGKIAQAARRAMGLAARRKGGLPAPSELAAAARALQAARVGALAQRVETALTWEEVVLPDDVVAQYTEVLSYAKHRRTLFDDWGFYRKLTYGRGLSVLLSGPPGTGKTMLAGIMAVELGLDLYAVDLSQVQSKFIGETEKHLSELFDYATESGAALLFDEADSLFAKRTEVKSSVDRFANLNVNYLLQRIEAFEGVTVLTTNFKQSLDPALLRRIRFKIEIPAPDVEQRKRLWASMIPPETPTSGQLDFRRLAHDFEIAGGHIKNSVVRAATAAVASGSALTNEHLLDAAEITCKELGMLVRR